MKRLLAGEKLAAEHRVEWLHCDRRAETASDVGGRGVRLLGARPALLDRKVRAVTSGVNISHAGHPGVLVDRDETAGILGQAFDRRPVHHRQRDHLMGFDPAIARGHH